jgi:hypothetical protein
VLSEDHSCRDAVSRLDAAAGPTVWEIMTLPQPTALSALLNGCDGECPCCHQRFADAA